MSLVRMSAVVLVVLLAVSGAALAQVVIDFDDQAGFTCPCGVGTAVPAVFIVDNDYLDQGVVFASEGGGLVLASGGNPVSPPNVVAPTSPGPVFDYRQDSFASFWVGGSEAVVDHVSISLTSSSGTTRLSALDVAGDVLGSSVGDSSETVTVSFPFQIHSVVVTSESTVGYAFDDFTFDGLKPAECFLVVGGGPGDGGFLQLDHLFETQVGPEVEDSYVVLMDDVPEFVLPIQNRDGFVGWGGKKSGAPGFVVGQVSDIPAETPSWMLDMSFAVQVLMWNPEVFPQLPEQSTPGLQVTLLPNGAVSSTQYGIAVGGLEIWHEVSVNEDGQRVIRFPFDVPGL